MKTILIIGTYDTKSEELEFVAQTIARQGGKYLRMDVSILGESAIKAEISKHDVIAAAGCTISEIVALDDENLAFQRMAKGAADWCARLYGEQRIDGMIVLGGTMGTDLALDCAMSLPMGVPKYIVSTVAFSPLIAIERIAPDVQMILWSGGLYGLNSLCQATLSQAAGAVLGAANAVDLARQQKPMVGMTSLGKTTMKYMVQLKPALEQRGFEVAVFHSTGLGGRAFETLAAQERFVCVMDFCLQELVNEINGSTVSSGADRLTRAGAAGIAQLVAPGATDIIDFLASSEPPLQLANRDYHAHNRLIASVFATAGEREEVAEQIALRLKNARGPVHFILPLLGVEEWDRPGNPAHNPATLAAFNEATQRHIAKVVPTTTLPCHINDELFVETVLQIFDDWCKQGKIRGGQNGNP